MLSRESMIRKYKLTLVEKILSFVILGIGVGMLILIKTDKKFASQSSVINNPGFFPMIVAYAFIVMSVVLFFSTLKKGRTETVTVNWFGFIIALIWLGFGFLCKRIGFVLSGAIAHAITLFLFGVRKKLVLFLTSIITPLVIYLLLGTLMGVKLPTLFL